ncbi:MAG: DUF1415 domain-containing protein [Methylophaga sp.]|jgi:hypothetical protein|uniref:DUF1415 domain-containing protein n=1 Tax=Methylophaga sp. TaxID=2024840 RepID=UPI000C0DBCFE|nr:DUF1415 domain-containing protein [Methylophaga sp.]MBL1458300.1 DUF1415 domain-containing protein [Methylophaga sp.]
MKKATRPSEIRNDEEIVLSVRQWVNTFVMEMNLCPFAKHEMLNNRVRFATTSAITEEQLLMSLQDELELLNSDPSVETTLLIHSNVLQDFDDYNQFLSYADNLLVELGLEGTYQIASFHPDYQFGGTNPDDAENYTNRSPYPLLHLIREASLERAIVEYPDVDQIPIRNVALMNSLGHNKLQALFERLFKL